MSAYQPFVPARRPSGRPSAQPRYRVLVHRQYVGLWNQITERVGIEAARQFWDHVANTPGIFPSVGASSVLRGKAGQPKGPGFSHTIHYEISGAGRINYQFCNEYRTHPDGDPHPVVFILTIQLGSHWHGLENSFVQNAMGYLNVLNRGIACSPPSPLLRPLLVPP